MMYYSWPQTEDCFLLLINFSNSGELVIEKQSVNLRWGKKEKEDRRIEVNKMAWMVTECLFTFTRHSALHVRLDTRMQFSGFELPEYLFLLEQKMWRASYSLCFEIDGQTSIVFVLVSTQIQTHPISSGFDADGGEWSVGERFFFIKKSQGFQFEKFSVVSFIDFLQVGMVVRELFLF